ncbi:DUF6164 family protein [Arenimonas fontis]|uniref:DUF2007 domain-containing protein n=1 Tax=Arenimonas fontis TaxID=2608255 RepID=A0A5B2ZBC9_9GAMM|nr:DUF6164 family protein [Arenimonas fontis]KAA2284474.1 hypothetical protein F0415_09110 [Arenimonas fontis]
MPVLLMHLRDVPEDELEEVRALLEAEGVDFYETRPSMWGVSGGGIWLPDDADEAEEARARALLERYQAERSRRMRELRAAGHRESPWREHPLRSLAALLGLLIMLGLVTVPFLLLGR